MIADTAVTMTAILVLHPELFLSVLTKRMVDMYCSAHAPAVC